MTKKKPRRPWRKKSGVLSKAKPRPKSNSDDPPKPKLNKRGLKRISDELVHDTILQLCREAGLEGSTRPETIAQTLYPEQWQTMLKRVRFTAKQLAIKGDLVILRKGKPVEPDVAKGLIRLRITEQGLATEEEE